MEEIGDNLDKVEVPVDNTPAVPPAPAPKPPFWPNFFHQFAPLLYIMTVVVILLLVVVSYYAYPKITNKNSNTQTSTIPTPTPNPTANWKTYTGSYFTFKYPSSWQQPQEAPDGSLGIKNANSTGEFSVLSGNNSGHSVQENEQFIDDMASSGAKKLLVDNSPAALGEEDTVGNVATAFVLSKDKMLIYSVSISDQSKNTNIKNLLNQILSTFKFTPPAGGQTQTNSNVKTSCAKDADCVLTNYDPCPNTKCNDYSKDEWVSVNGESLAANSTPAACTLIYPVCSQTLEQSNAQYSAKCVNKVCKKVH